MAKLAERYLEEENRKVGNTEEALAYGKEAGEIISTFEGRLEVEKLPRLIILPEEQIWGGVHSEDSGYYGVCPVCGKVLEDEREDFEKMEITMGGYYVQLFRCKECGAISSGGVVKQSEALLVDKKKITRKTKGGDEYPVLHLPPIFRPWIGKEVELIVESPKEFRVRLTE